MIRKLFSSLSIVLLFSGLLLILMGLYFIVSKGVVLGFEMYNIMVPVYEFETLMPGNYTHSRTYPLYFATLKQDTIEPVNWVYDMIIPWQNCTGARYISTWFEARREFSYNETPRLILEIQGCRQGICEIVVKSDLMQDALVARESDLYVGKNAYYIQNSILDYDHFNITLTPVGLVVRDFGVLSEVYCIFQYELNIPVLTARLSDYKHHPLYIPVSVDITGLQTGITLSIIGLTMLIASIYLYIVSKI